MHAIVDYDAGNLRSVARACAEVGVSAEITNDANKLRDAERVIFPGVGAAGPAMRSIRAYGIDQALREAYAAGTPILGICMGLQISLQHSAEDDQKTLGLIEGTVERFEVRDRRLKVPHMGWNDVEILRQHPVLTDVSSGEEFYFVHSYFPRPTDANEIYAVARYEDEFCCALGRGNYFGTQFHPEKSGRSGLRLLDNFLRWDGAIAK